VGGLLGGGGKKEGEGKRKKKGTTRFPPPARVVLLLSSEPNGRRVQRCLITAKRGEKGKEKKLERKNHHPTTLFLSISLRRARRRKLQKGDRLGQKEGERKRKKGKGKESPPGVLFPIFSQVGTGVGGRTF